MKKIIFSHLKKKKNKSISLDELSKLLPGDTEYRNFAMYIKELQKEGLLIPLKSHGMNGKSIQLYNTYKINKAYFKAIFHDKLQNLRFKIHPSIDLQKYYEYGEECLEEDLSFINTINGYIMENGLPEDYVFSPQRSYEIMGDEKWIDEKGGKSLLIRLNLWEKFKIQYRTDPLMIAINPDKIVGYKHRHLILENKSSFYDFLDVLKDTDFTSLIYGGGWKVTSNIIMLERQLGLENKENEIYYFGDIDYEGIAIWNLLKEKRNIKLATSFYRELLKKTFTKGKENQNKNRDALNNFIKNFNDKEAIDIQKLLTNGGYYPQELLTKEEIKDIWRQDIWSQ